MCKKFAAPETFLYYKTYDFLFFSDCFLIIMLRWSGPYIGSTLNNQPHIYIGIYTYICIIYTIGSLVERFFLLFGAKLLRLDGIITEFFLTDYYWKNSFFFYLSSDFSKIPTTSILISVGNFFLVCIIALFFWFSE